MTDRGNSPASRDIAHVLHPYTNLATHEVTGPHIVTKGRGVYVTDEAGKEYIEGLAGLWCTSFGFGEEELVKAATEQLSTLPYYQSFAGKSVHPSIDLAERLKEIAPVEFSKVFFANSGSEANDSAIKMVWYFNNARGRPKKKKFISRLRGYHGVTVASGSLTGLPYAQADFDLPLDFVRHTMAPDYYRGGEEVPLRPGPGRHDPRRGPGDRGRLHRRTGDGRRRRDYPAQDLFRENPGGIEKIRSADDRRRGDLRLWPHGQHVGQPDLWHQARHPDLRQGAVIGLPAHFGRDDQRGDFPGPARQLRIFGHGYTYSAHPACAAVALRTQELMQERDIIGHVKAVAPHFQNRIAKLGEHALVGQARGVGLIGAVEIVADKQTKRSYDPAAKVGALIQNACQEHGLITRAIDETEMQLKQQGASAAQ